MGVQILNKDVSVISSVLNKPKASIGSVGGVGGWTGGNSDISPNPSPDWGDIGYDDLSDEYFYSQQQIQGINTTITIKLQYDDTLIGEVYYNVSTTQRSLNNSFPPTNQSDDDGSIPFTRILHEETLTVSNNQWISFGFEFFSPYDNSTTVTVRNVSDSNVQLDQFQIYKANSGCYLTTATVQYKGLDDNGPELTAMRLLREHYRGDVYYDNLIIEYYQNSPIILNGINSSMDPSSEYEFIYQSVLRVKVFVDLNQWEQAKDEYINTYFTLKNKYI